MRVYLDNCCYNRPFDEGGGVRVGIETAAKLKVQDMMRMGEVEYVWSDILGAEVSANPFADRRFSIMQWIPGATEYVSTTEDVEARACEIESMGIRPKDALHLASAEVAACDWFLTTDDGILRKIRELGDMRVVNPVEFIIRKDEYGQD